MKKVTLQKYLLYYSYTEKNEIKFGWCNINTAKQPANFKEAKTHLSRSLKRHQATKERQIIEIKHLYKDLNTVNDTNI